MQDWATPDGERQGAAPEEQRRLSSGAPPSGPSDTPGWSAVPGDPEADRSLFGNRIAYFGRVFFLLSSAFYARNALAIAFIEGIWPPLTHRSFLLHAAGICLHLVQWLSCRSGKRTLEQLRWLDAIGLVGAMAVYGSLTVSEASGFDHAVAVRSAGAEVLLVALIMLGLVLTHAIIVPLGVRRMCWLSTATCLVGLAAAYAVAVVGSPSELLTEKPWVPTHEAIFVAVWALLAVTVATIAARVIHGLKQRVRDANEIGQYTLEERIGEGGMGVVYLARHALLRRPTAIKLLPPDRAGEHAVRRFEQEVQLTSALTHPNTIAIFDFGRTPEGVFYYAMEYLDGITLEDLVTHAGRQPPARVIQLLKQVCGALREAHDLGLVHRDIKPANLMLCVRGGMPDQIKVLDFGLVKEHARAAAPGLSMTGAIIGTPAYLAPESIMDPSRADARSDLYAVGAVGYCLLVGEPVFVSQSVVEVCAHHLHSEPIPPSERVHEQLPPALDALILSCLAKDPAHRPASAGELIQRLAKLGDIGAWSQRDAETWWREQAPRVRQAARANRSGGSTPGPRTVAVDLDRRAPSRARALTA